MGYRSDVRILVNQEGLNILREKTIAYAKAYCASTDEIWAQDYCKQSVVDQDWDIIGTNVKDEVILEQSCIKWDEDYKDVKWLLDGLEVLSEMEIPYHLIQIGEDGEVCEDDNTHLGPSLKTTMYVRHVFDFY